MAAGAGMEFINRISCDLAAIRHLMLGQIFKAYDVRARYPDPLDEDAVLRVGFATGQFLMRQVGPSDGGQVLVSRDMRPSSPALVEALITGLRAAGTSVVDLGMCDTSFIYFAVNHLDADGGIQVTASHNPIEYNGLKISGRQARPIGAQTGLPEIQKLAESLPRSLAGNMRSPKGGLQQMDLWAPYRRHVRKFLAPLSRPLSVVIDASNGMAGMLVPKVFDGVPNLKIIPLNFAITGSFAHDPNPLAAESMVPTQEGVLQHQADLGACFDADADRCLITDQTGRIISSDHLTALLCEHFLPQAPGSAVVYDLRSSKVVEEQIRRLGGVPHRSRVGHVFMKSRLRQTNGIFGGELAAHFYFRNNFFADSGAIALASVLSFLAGKTKPLGELVAPFRKYPQSGEVNFRAEDKEGILAAIKSRYAGIAATDELDGVTVDAWKLPSGPFGPEGQQRPGGFWFNVRPSNTEPLLRLNAEARDQDVLKDLLDQITPHLGEPV